MTSRAADYPARHLRLAAEGPGPAERLLDVLGRWASTAPDPAAATAAGLPALLPGLAGEPVQMPQEDAGTARPSPLSVPAARPDPAYHRPDLFRARVQQVTAVRSGRNHRGHRRRRLQAPETRGNDLRSFMEQGHRRLSHRRPP